MKPDSGQLDLERLQAAEAPELHRALDALKQRLPDAQQLAALSASLSQIGLPVARPEPAAASAAPSATGLKLLLGAGVIGPVTLALLLWRSEPANPTPPSTITPPAAVAQHNLPPSVDALQGTMAGPNGIRPSSARGVMEPTNTPLPTSQPSNVRDREGAPQPSASSAQVNALPPAAITQKAKAEAVRTPVAPERATPVSSSGGDTARPTELALLRDAQLALRGNPSQALALTEQHRNLFPRGAMVQERELIAISALARLGRHTAVLARAAQFEHDFPNSPYRKQISALAQ